MSRESPDHSLIEFAKRVELLATRFLDGQHASRRPGSNIDFEEIRPYQAGDDLRFLDWKRLGAQDKLFLKQARSDQKTAWVLLLDRSPSMMLHDKWQAAVEVAAGFQFLAKVWGDSFEIHGEGRSLWPEVIDRRDDQSLGSQNIFAASFDQELTKRLLVISDFFFDEQGVRTALRDWQSSFSSVWSIQPLSRIELELGLSDEHEFIDSESSDRLQMNAAAVRSAYLKELQVVNSSLQAQHQHEHQFATFSFESETILNLFERLHWA